MEHVKAEPIVTANTETTSGVPHRVIDPERGDHYGRMMMQPLDFITANHLDFLSGNVIKYVTRAVYGDTHATRDRDLAKAQHYLHLMREREATRS
jgi:hypothetical protein